MELIARACALAGGIDGRGAVRLHERANLIYHLPQADAVLRLRRTHGSREWHDRLAASVELTRWLADRGFPTTVPLDVRHPVDVGEWTATFWRHVPATQAGAPARAAELAELLRELHRHDPPIRLPATNLLGSLVADLHYHSSHLTSEQRAWLVDRSNEIDEAYPGTPMPLGHGHIHGDAHAGNLLPLGEDHVLTDWDSASHGPRAQDLIPTLHRVRRLGHRRTDWVDLCMTYGLDPEIEHDPGIQLLQQARELRTLAAYLRRADQPKIKTELQKRLRTLIAATSETWLSM